MLERMVVHASASGAPAVIPFASFVWFCHEENFYLNAFHNRVDLAAETLRTRTNSAAVVLYPGDRWKVGSAHDSAPAIARWSREYASLATRERIHSPRVATEDLVAAGDEFCTRVRTGTDTLRLRLRLAMQRFRSARALAAGTLPALAALAMLGVPEASVYLEDLDQSFLFTIFHGLRPVSRRRDECDVAMSSDSLRYAFQHMWGGESLQVNGRFRELRPDGRLALFQYFWLAAGRNRGEAIGWGGLFRRLLGRRS
jgi:hypothetical protein